MIIDGHVHIASARYVPIAFLEGVADNLAEQARTVGATLRRARILDKLLETYQSHAGDSLIAEMDRNGIDHCVVLLPDFTYRLPGGELSIAEMHEEHAEILNRHRSRFRVFAGVDPRWGTDGLDLFVNGVENHGFSGLKLYPPCGYAADDKSLDPFYEYCHENRLPVLLHTGPTSPVLSFDEASPRYVDTPARRYPNVPFILAHGGTNEPDQCVQLCKYRPNVYLDVSGSQESLSNPYQKSRFLDLFSRNVNHKLIFGTDWPVNAHGDSNRALIDSIVEMTTSGLPKREANLILGGNINHLLREPFPEPASASTPHAPPR